MCEAFSCVPSVAERELDQHADLVFDILDLRAAARAWRTYQAFDTMDAKARRKALSDDYVVEARDAEFSDVKAHVP